MVDATL